jgi:two-component system, LytTR family, sensor kinase
MFEIGRPQLINILGHAGGALIFAIFLCLLFSRRGWSGARGRYLPAAAAGLSIVWDLGSLLVLTRPGMPQFAMNLVVAISFSVFSLLPAVLLHISLGNSRLKLVQAGYLLSAIAVCMHFWEVRGANLPLHQSALLLITIGFLVLTGMAIVTENFRGGTHRPGGARILAAMCLALFAASFVHFGAEHPGQAWSAELVVHHAGIPLALFVLLQDYRFVLLDAFVRFLANGFLAALFTGLMIQTVFRVAPPDGSNPLQRAFLIASVCLFLVSFAGLRNLVQSWLTHAVFRRGNLAGLPAILKSAPSFSNEQEYLAWAASRVASAARTTEYSLESQSKVDPDRAESGWAEAAVPIRLGQGSRVLLLGPRKGGQRYLGADCDALANAAAEIAEYVESLRRHEMNRLVSQAELRALQSQINPHFLFNALNTLYGSIPREAAAGRRMVLNLAEIFRYFLQSDKTFVPLEQEMQIVRAYLEVEQSRLGKRLRVEIDVADAALEMPIPVLSIQPLVENAIKHGIATSSEPGYVRIQTGFRDEQLRIVVENSSSGAAPAGTGTGVGLQNVRRRLEICYGPASKVLLSLNPTNTIVELSIPMAGQTGGAGLSLRGTSVPL